MTRHFVEKKTGDIFAYDSVNQADLISNIDLTLFTEISTLPNKNETWDGSAFTLDNAKVLKEQNENILTKINNLEAQQTPRLIREAMQGVAFSVNKLKQFDTDITALRLQLK